MAKRKQSPKEERPGGEGCEEPVRKRRRKSTEEHNREGSEGASNESASISTGTVRKRRTRKTGTDDERPVDPVLTKEPRRKTRGSKPVIEVPPVQNCDDIEPEPTGPCCSFCGQPARRGFRLRTTSIEIKIDDRIIRMKSKELCEDCIVHIPDYLAGSMHLGLAIPKEKFTRKFLLPPLEVCMDKNPKATKKSVKTES